VLTGYEVCCKLDMREEITIYRGNAPLQTMWSSGNY